jgi:hypothetical protein
MTDDPATSLTLTWGSHLAPEDGVCLMEAVSIAAGLPFSDAPSCTPPLLAHLARLVNDASSTAGRHELVALVPALASSTAVASATECTPVPDALDAAVQLVRACTEYALGLHPTPLVRHFHGLAVRLGQRDAGLTGRWPVLLRRLGASAFSRGPAHRALEASVTACLAVPDGERDAALADLLRTGLSASLRPATVWPCR